MDKMLNNIIEIARQAGGIMLRYHKAAIHQKEGHCNFVTDADIAVQEFLKESLLSLIPGSRFVAEEQANELLTEAETFVVDPIDGTLNYMRGRNASAVSIALLKKKKPVMGVVYNPYTDEMFTSREGQGAYLNDERIRVSEIGFENAVITFGTSPSDHELAEHTLEIATSFLLRAGDLRRTGSAALDLCDVACGRTDVFFELRLRPWDVAAGALLVQEAGGQFISLGQPGPYFDGPCGILASNNLCVEQAFEIIESIGAV